MEVAERCDFLVGSAIRCLWDRPTRDDVDDAIRYLRRAAEIGCSGRPVIYYPIAVKIERAIDRAGGLLGRLLSLVLRGYEGRDLGELIESIE